MEMQYFNNYSYCLNRNMEFKVYGHAGRPVVFIPCQDGNFYDFENFRMIDHFAPYIEDGRIMVFAIQTIDGETWSNLDGDKRWRIERYEQWIHYVTDELVPFIRQMVNERNGWTGDAGLMIYGASMGATHAANLYFRFPYIFDRLLALSGVYNIDFAWNGYMDDLTYNNSPAHYLKNMPADHPYIKLYNQKKAIICVGQGPWEMVNYTDELNDIFKEKGINVWVDYWGNDVNHDWPWWYKQVEYFLPKLLEE